jgi:tetratricopeptide (TPR) repeat protein
MQESTDEFWRAERKRPAALNVLGNLVMNYIITGQYAEVDRVAARIAAAGNKESALYHKAPADFLRGRKQIAIQTFAALTQSHDADLASLSFSSWAQALAESGNLTEAEQVLQQGVRHDETANDPGRRTEKQLALAFLRLRSGDRAAARVLSLDAVAGDPSLQQLTKAGSILAWAGYLPESRQVLSRLQRSATSPAAAQATLQVSGEILLADGRTKEAIDKFEQLDRQQAPLLHRLYLARAYRRAGDVMRASERCRVTETFPGLFWYYADYELPTLLTYSCPGTGPTNK